MRYHRLRGCDDILPPEVEVWQELERKAVELLTLFGYQEIRTPILEHLELFQRSIGKSTDIVEKEIFSFKDRKGRSICLRPEVTASVARAYVENGLFQKSGVIKFYYLGPMFRAERPQKGRKRQFHQIGVEAIGCYQPQLDAEVIYLASRLIEELGIDDFRLEINTLGCKKDKKNISDYLRGKIGREIDRFCVQCQKRFQRNVLRILDCKNPDCIHNLRQLNLDIKSRICSDCQEHYTQVKQYLKALKVDFVENPYLVRGLDYYTRTVFELVSDKLGAQNTIAAGGRYDTLIQEVGGPPQGAIGFALGIERIMLLVSRPQSRKHIPEVFLVVQDKSLLPAAMVELMRLRENGILSDMDYRGGSLRSQMRMADDRGAKYVLILGLEEMETGEYAVKDMTTGRQQKVRKEEIIKFFQEV